ncbi:hypothetical protein ANAEL_03782 [Anaerolineales bacterium]|nr:hypothetical protein ANAEL_03782 [Anaerolineales bacterium]
MSINLLRNRSVHSIFQSGLYPAIFQAITAGVFVGLYPFEINAKAE